MRGRRILLVVRDAALTRLLAQALESQGYDVSTVTSAARALEQVVATDHAALLVHDELADGTGVELHGRIGSVAPALARRTFFLSGSPPAERLRTYVASAGCGILLEPLDLRTAVFLIRQVAEEGPRYCHWAR